MNFCPFAWRNSPYSTCPLISWRIRGRLVTIPEPRGKKSLKVEGIDRIIIPFSKLYFYLPTKFSKTEDFPADWPPTTAIWGKSMVLGTPSWVKTSCILFMIGMRASIPAFPLILMVFTRLLTWQSYCQWQYISSSRDDSKHETQPRFRSSQTWHREGDQYLVLDQLGLGPVDGSRWRLPGRHWQWYWLSFNMSDNDCYGSVREWFR